MKGGGLCSLRYPPAFLLVRKHRNAQGHRAHVTAEGLVISRKLRILCFQEEHPVATLPVPFLNFAEATLFCLLLLVSLSSCSLASCFFDLGFGLALGFGWALALVGVRERPEAKMSETI